MKLAAMLLAATACLGACSGGPATPPAAVSGCLAQATAVYDATPVARRADGTIWVANDRTRFVEIPLGEPRRRAIDLATSGSTAYGTAVGCAVVEDGGVWCFPLFNPLTDSTDVGAGLGPGVTTTDAVAVLTGPAASSPAALTGARQIGASMNGNGATFCVVTAAGGVWCWGSGLPVSILGRDDGDTSAFARPVLADATTPLANAAEVRVGYDSACARKRDGSVWCWGDGSLGQRGVDAAAVPATPYPTQVALPGPAKRLAASPGRTHCALLQDERVACWGWNAYAQAGASDAIDSVPPTIILTAAGGPPVRGLTDLAPDRGMQAMCGNTGADGFVCWGHPFPLAGGPDAISPYPVAIPTAAPVRAPLSAYGGRDGAMVYVAPNGQLTIGAGALPFSVQPPCAGTTAP
jgi:hypothetical protein